MSQTNGVFVKQVKLPTERKHAKEKKRRTKERKLITNEKSYTQTKTDHLSVPLSIWGAVVSVCGMPHRGLFMLGITEF